MLHQIKSWDSSLLKSPACALRMAMNEIKVHVMMIPIFQLSSHDLQLDG